MSHKDAGPVTMKSRGEGRLREKCSDHELREIKNGHLPSTEDFIPVKNVL